MSGIVGRNLRVEKIVARVSESELQFKEEIVKDSKKTA
jgi:hypothetical protein